MFKYERKLLKFWAQSFLLGVPTIIVGFRDQQGIVHRVEELDTASIPAKVKKVGKNSWDGNICINFAAEFLECKIGLSTCSTFGSVLTMPQGSRKPSSRTVFGGYENSRSHRSSRCSRLKIPGMVIYFHLRSRPGAQQLPEILVTTLVPIMIILFTINSLRRVSRALAIKRPYLSVFARSSSLCFSGSLPSVNFSLLQESLYLCFLCL